MARQRSAIYAVVRGLWFLFILMILLPLGLFASAQTRPVKDWLAIQISAAASDQAATITIGRIDGVVPIDITIDRVTVADAEGEWLTTTGVELRWSPAQLFEGTFWIDRVAAENIAVMRPPVPAADSDDSAPQALAFESPVAVVVEQIDLPRIDLGEPVAGVAAVFGIDGALGLDPDRGAVSIDLAAERKDGTPGAATLVAEYLLAEQRATLDASVEEPPGGVIAGLIGLPGPAAVALSAKGDGTLTDWAGTFTARIDGYANLGADLALSGNNGGHRFNLNATGELAELVAVFVREAASIVEPRLTLSMAGTRDAGGMITFDHLNAASGSTKIELSGRIDPTALHADFSFQAWPGRLAEVYAPETAALIADGVSGRLAGTYDLDGTVTVDEVRLLATAGEVGARGTVDTASAMLDLEIEVARARLSAFSEIAGLPLTGGLALVGRIDGPLDAAAISDARVTVTDFATDTVSFARLEGVLAASPDGAWTAADPMVNFDGQGFVSGMRVDGQEQILEALSGDRVDWRAVGRAQPASGNVVLSELAVATDTAIVGGTAAMQTDGPVTATIVLELDAIDSFAAIAGTALAGRLNATIEVSGELSDELSDDMAEHGLEAAIEARFQDFKTGVQSADIALGARPALNATMKLADTGAVTIHDLSLRGAALTATGTFGLAADESLSGDLRVGLPDLGHFRSVAGTPIEGALTVALQPAGTLTAPAVDMSFAGTDIAAGGAPPADMTGRLTGRDLLERPRGAIALSATANGVDATVNGDYDLVGSRLRLTGLEARAAGLAVAGGISVAFDSGLIDGQLAGRADDVAAVAALAGLALGGAVTFDAALAAHAGEQAITLAAEARDLTYPDADLAIEAMSVRADGTLGDLDVELDVVDGTVAGRAVSVDSTANIAMTGATTRITVETLQGEVDTVPIVLTRAATIARRADGLGLEGLSLKIAEGVVEAEGELRANDLQARVTATGVSLAGFGGGVEGVLDGEATLAGSAPHPTGALIMRIEGLRDPSLAVHELPNLNAALDARWTQGVLDADAELAGPGGARLSGTVSMPLSLAPDTLTPVIQDNAALDGRVEGEAELAEFAPLFLSDLDRLVGQLALELQIAGTLAAPTASGRASIVNGFYENGAAGTVLTDLEVELEGDGQRIVLQRLSATDGGGGTINGSGNVGVDLSGGFPTNLEVAFSNFLAVRRTDAEIPLDGTLRFEGDLSGYTLAGLLTVPQAEIRIPDRLPPNVVELDVIEVGQGVDAAAPQAKPDKADDAAAVPLTLDIGIDMPGRVFVRGRGLTSEWRGTVTASGPAEAPLLVGELTLVRGTFDLIGKILTLERGTVSMTEDAPADPEIAALATARLEDGTARVEISGRASNPQITLSAEPPLPEDEVLARLLFGSSVGELTPVQAVQLANGIATLSGKGSGLGVLDKIRETAGVDVLDVRSDGEDAADTSVRAGKYLADDVMLYIEQGRGAGSSKATLEVDINDYLSVETDVGADSQSSIGVNIKTDY